MKICIYGAGAIGGYLGAELIRAGYDVTLIARGPHLEAMRKNGLTLEIGDQRHTVTARCTDDPAEAGPQDYVIVTLKAHSVTPIVEQMQPLLGPDTAVVTAQNGILWWYFHALPGPFEAGGWRSPTRAAASGTRWVRSAPSAAWSIPPARS
jgi:2-dehydropantoate 2-reductase